MRAAMVVLMAITLVLLAAINLAFPGVTSADAVEGSN